MSSLSDATARPLARGGLLFLLVLVSVFCLRLPHVDRVVIDWDESAYFIVAQDIANGGDVYRTSFENKGPLLYILLAPVVLFFGPEIVPLRLFTTICLLLTMACLYATSRRFIGEESAAVPPLVYGLFFTTSDFGGLASNAELFMMLPTVLAWHCFLVSRHATLPRPGLLFWAGFFSSAALLIKSVALFSLLAFPLALVTPWLSPMSRGWGERIRDLLSFALGGVIMTICVMAYLASRGALAEAYDAYVMFNLRVIDSVDFGTAVKLFLLFLKDVAARDVITLLAAASFVFLAGRPCEDARHQRFFRLATLLALFSAMGILLARSMYNHYYLQLALPFSYLIGLAAVHADFRATTRKQIIVGLVLLLTGYSVFTASCFFTKENIPDENVTVAQYISENTAEDDHIFLLGGQPIVYFLSNRRAPMKYFWWLHHRDEYRKFLPAYDQAMGKFHSSLPKYIVFQENKVRVPFFEEIMLAQYELESEIGRYRVYRHVSKT